MQKWNLSKREILLVRFVKFFLWLMLLIVVCAISYWCAFAMSENDSGQGVIVRTFATLMYVFSFPSIFILNWLGPINEWTFYAGLLFNCIFYAFIIERISAIIKQYKLKKTISK